MAGQVVPEPQQAARGEAGVAQVTRQAGGGVTVGGHRLKKPAFPLEWVVQLLRGREMLPHPPHRGSEYSDLFQQGRVVEVAEHLVPVGDQVKPACRAARGPSAAGELPGVRSLLVRRINT